MPGVAFYHPCICCVLAEVSKLCSVSVERVQQTQDYNLRNTFESLADASVQVSAIFSELHDEYGYHGDHESDQTDDRQHLAG